MAFRRMCIAWVVCASVATAAQASPYFYLLNTDGGGAWPGRVDEIDPGTGDWNRTLVDLHPSPFLDISDWKGFARDSHHYYLLNTEGGAGDEGTIDRVDLDGSGRTTVLNIIDEGIFSNADMFKGFAADDDSFYFLNVTGGQPYKGRVYRTNKDGTGKEMLFDLSPDPYNSIGSWRGLASDGTLLYVLNNNGGQPFAGRIDQWTTSGTGRRQIADISPSLYSSIDSWMGFAALPVPEPATTALLGLAACGLGGYVRRRRKA